MDLFSLFSIYHTPFLGVKLIYIVYNIGRMRKESLSRTLLIIVAALSAGCGRDQEQAVPTPTKTPRPWPTFTATAYAPSEATIEPTITIPTAEPTLAETATPFFSNLYFPAIKKEPAVTATATARPEDRPKDDSPLDHDQLLLFFCQP